MNLLVAAEHPERYEPDLRRIVSALDPALPIGRTTTLEQLLEARSGTPRFTSSLVSGFAVLAVVLMVSGIYGLLAFLASARASEMGVRLALGATRTAVASLLLRQALRLAVAGAALGIVASLFVAPWLSTMLFGVEPTDPMTLAVVAALILVVAAAAAALPARRAARVDPVVALRAE
jgi:ABC-type antimicrobial peptide transport system permease subunit